MLLAHRARADLLAPLFQPNTCPDQFLQMYGTTVEVAVKEGPDVAFSVLTKVGWGRRGRGECRMSVSICSNTLPVTQIAYRVIDRKLIWSTS